MSGPCTDCGGPDYQTLLARIAALGAELAKYVWAMNIADGERDALRRHLTVALATNKRLRGELEETTAKRYVKMRKRAERAEAENERLRVQHCDLIRCEGCEKTVESVDAEGWHRTDDDCDLCPKCWAEFVAEARAEGETP